MSDLRWALLILGVVFIAALILWERRRPRQASGAPERASRRESAAEPQGRLLREPPLTLPDVRVREPAGRPDLPVVEVTREAVPVLEPAAQPLVDEAPAPAEPSPEDALSATDELLPLDEQSLPDELRASDEQDSLQAAAVLPPEADDAAGVPPIISAAPAPALEAALTAAPAAASVREALPELPPGGPLVVDWPAEHERRILALRLVAPQCERFAGRSLRQALAAEGFLLGQFAIFHKPDDERRAVLSAASLTRPGTFDMETMDSQHYGGLSLFAVLPGPKPARQAFDELVFAARNLNERLHGVLQDEQGTPLTPARIAQLREQLRAGAGS